MTEEINTKNDILPISKWGVGKDRGKTGERKIIYNEMTSDWYISYDALFVATKVINLIGKDRGKTNVIVRGDK